MLEAISKTNNKLFKLYMFFFFLQLSLFCKSNTKLFATKKFLVTNLLNVVIYYCYFNILN